MRTESNRPIHNIQGKKCWYVSGGRNTGSSFHIHLGMRIPRTRPLDSPHLSPILRKAGRRLPQELRDYISEWGLLIWCSWRLTRSNKIVLTSDDCDNNTGLVSDLSVLVGKTLVGIRQTPMLDLALTFSSRWKLDVFCSNGVKQPSLDTNWDLFHLGQPVQSAKSS